METFKQTSLEDSYESKLNPTGIPQDSELYVDLNHSLIQAKKFIDKIKTDFLGLGTSPENNARMAVLGQYYSIMYANGSVSASPIIDWARANVQEVSATGNLTFTLNNGRTGGRYIIKIVQDESGSRTYTWPSNVLWSGGTAPTGSGGAKIDVISLVFDGSTFYAASSVNF